MRKCVLGVLTLLVMLLADVAVAQNPQGVNVVFIGNSITYGACLSDRANDAPPAVVKRELEQRGVGAVSVANLGKSVISG